jgi:hypothetical protein
MEVSGQRYAHAALYPRGMESRCPLNRRVGGPQIRSGHRGLKKNYLCLSRGSDIDRPVVQPVARHYTDCYPASFIFLCQSTNLT